ncbi:hypothetical protein SAMN05192589_102151 [Paracidovorax valerianellae]|uniref:Uncharacterized protein n=1 Tax=Paracidovorax valerianellae TaxID=187868 RepID=A0A1G6LEY7_9BURK|nr:hypothetical protein [Paracidovorax valerianellae]SDC41818.1 hypothetical protein SAMN05192589_102151 [Paracidovorax valerianellae]
MTSSTETIRRLAEMSDPSAFERLAAAVLRAANPYVYGNMAHPGVQPGGKTVRAPFDNVGWLNLPNGQSRLVCAAHTTEQNDLSGKWLHDPSTVKVRRPGGKPTKPAGDLIKGIEEIEKLRTTTPGLGVTYALTSNIEVSLELRTAAEQMALVANVELDVWSVSRIAHFLDTDPTGQLIRRSHLGSEIELLSRELLLEMGKRSIRDHFPYLSLPDAVHRDEFALGLSDLLVVGDSGMGKTTACAVALNSHIEAGLPAIAIPSEFVEVEPTLEAALEKELRRQHPGLESAAGERAVALCTGDAPLMVLFEDINRSSSPERLLNKILSWTKAMSGGSANVRGWRAVCPIWPRHLNAIEEQKGLAEGVEILRIDKFSQAEAVRAISTRATLLGVTMDEGRADYIASRLGCDPLLIGLHDIQSDVVAADVIQSYIAKRLRLVASARHRTPSEMLEAVHALLRSGLQQRNLSPSWGEVRSWIHDKEVLDTLRNVALEGSIIRLSSSGRDETIAFRHDRVLHALASGSMTEVLSEAQAPEYVADPFFAEMAAGAAVEARLPAKALLDLTVASPTVAAHALRLASEQNLAYADIAAEALMSWLVRPETADVTMASRRYAVAAVLAETTSRQVLLLAEQFPRDDSLWWDPLWAAAFRNGNLRSGLAFLSRFELGMTVAGKQSLLSLVKRTYGDHLVDEVSKILQRADLDLFTHDGMRTGALRLAGYVGDSKLALAIRVCWDKDNKKERDLRSYLFAAARCCGDAAAATLDPILTAWESLPEDPESTIGQPVDYLASDGLAWEFRHYPPRQTVQYFVDRAQSSERLRWPITYMLRTVDHPIAVEHLARYAAAHSFAIFTSGLLSDWEPKSSRPVRQMSSDSKHRLLEIALSENEADDVRKQAFSFWDRSASPTDLQAMKQIPEGSLLFDRALRARARRRDYSVTPQVLLKIKGDPKGWLRTGIHIWSSPLTEVLESVLDQLAAKSDGDPDDLIHDTANALMCVETKRRVAMLSARWTKFQTTPEMVQVALLSVGPEALALVLDAITGAHDPGVLLKHFAITATVFSNGTQRLAAPEQLDNLRPFLQHLSEGDIVILSDACDKNGWVDFKRRYLEPRMRAMPNRRFFLPGDAVDMAALDKALNPKPGVLVNIHRWLENSMRRGMDREVLIEALMQWLENNNEERAIKIIAEIISEGGTRKEFRVFEEAAKQRPDTAGLIDEVRFDVFRRRLV